MDRPSCERCGVAMQVGFVLDQRGSNQDAPTYWAMGEYWWYMLGMSQRMQVQSFRCPECGRLENYALPASELATSRQIGTDDEQP